MGYFSWITSDTKQSICNCDSQKETFTVYMIDNKGNSFKEDHYEGYGVFGGKDYYVLLSEMNGIHEVSDEEKRSKGLDLAFSGNKNILFPKLVSYPNIKYNDVPDSEECPFQGFFYQSDFDDEEDYE